MSVPVLPSTDPTAAGEPGKEPPGVPGRQGRDCHKAGLEEALRCQTRKNKGDPVARMRAVGRQRSNRESRAGWGPRPRKPERSSPPGPRGTGRGRQEQKRG